MRILYTLNSGEPGGMEQHVRDLVSQMVTRGHDVFVWCSGGVIYDWYKLAGANVTEKPIKHDIDIAYIRELSKFLKDNKINVIHAHELKAVVNSLFGAFFAGVKIRICHVHTPLSNWQVSRTKRTIYNFFYSLLIRLFGTKEIALTESIKRIKISAGISKNKLSVIPNGIDVQRFYSVPTEKVLDRKEICRKYRLDPEVTIIGNLSRTTKEKGHDILINAFAELVNSGALSREQYFLLICGGGELEEGLWNLADKLGVKDRLIITGKFSDDAIKTKFYNTFDYFIFPTLAEGFGIVLIEALAAGIPVICSDLDVLKEVGGNYPCYFKTGDSSDLSKKVLSLLKEGEKSDATWDMQRNHVEKTFSLTKFGENYENLYREALSV